MAFQDSYPNAHYLTGELVDGMVGIKKALADGRFEPHEVMEVLQSIDPALAEYTGKMLKALKGLYPEVEKLAKLGPFTMMMEAAPYFAGQLMQVFR